MNKRTKVKLVYIQNDSARKATFKKRKKGLLNKVYELSTLCGIDACAIIFSPYDSLPATWPPQTAGVKRVLSQYRNISDTGKSRKVLTLGDFLQQWIEKELEKLKKQNNHNREKQVSLQMFNALRHRELLETFNVAELNDIRRSIDKKLTEICSRMDKLKEEATSTIGTTNNNIVLGDHPSASSSSQAAAAMATSFGGEIMDNGGSSSGLDYQMDYNMTDEMVQQQWLGYQPLDHMGFFWE